MSLLNSIITSPIEAVVGALGVLIAGNFIFIANRILRFYRYSETWKLETIEFNVEKDKIKDLVVSSGEEYREQIIVESYVLPSEERKILNQLRGLSMNTQHGHQGYTMLKIPTRRKWLFVHPIVTRGKRKWLFWREYQIIFNAIGDTSTHTESIHISNMRVLKNDWNI